MYNNPYMTNISQQSFNERIDGEIERLKQMKNQMQQPIQQPTNLTQNFQISPSHNLMKYANTLEEVQKEIIYNDTPFFSKDMSVLWVKNTKGDIKTYELKEIVPLDEKDIQIQYLQSQIEELKGMMKNVSNVTNAYEEQNSTNTTRDDDTDGTTIKKAESSSIQKISRSKKE